MKWQTLTHHLVTATLVAMFVFMMAPCDAAQGESTDAPAAKPSIQKPPPGFPKHEQPKSRAFAKRIARDLARFDRTVTASTDLPITVFPDGIGFDSLDEAFEFCSREKRSAKSGSRLWSYLVLQPGIYTGNYNMPQNTIVIGDAGPAATLIIGALGVNAPALTATAPSGSTQTQFGLMGIGVLGRAVAAVGYTGTNAHADLHIENCFISADATQVTPAIKMVGTGYGDDEEFEVSVVRSDVGSALGAACEANIGDYADLNFDHSAIWGYTLAVDVQGGGSNDSGIFILDCYLEGEDSTRPAVDVREVNWLSLHGCEIEATGGGDAVNYADSFGGECERCEIYSESGDGVTLSAITWYEMSYNKISAWDPAARAVYLANNSNAYLYYTGLNATTEIADDGSSYYTLTYCH